MQKDRRTPYCVHNEVTLFRIYPAFFDNTFVTKRTEHTNNMHIEGRPSRKLCAYQIFTRRRNDDTTSYIQQTVEFFLGSV